MTLGSSWTRSVSDPPGPYHPLAVAKKVEAVLEPLVVRMQLAGSVRRKKRYVRDIEFVVEPVMEQDLFEETMGPVLDELRWEVCLLGTWVKGGERLMQVSDVLGVEGLDLELYLCHPPAQWGSLLAIRTGPAALGVLAMTNMKKRFLWHEDGRVLDTRTNMILPTPEEEDYFRLAGLEYLPPEERDVYVKKLSKSKRGML